MLLFTKNQNLTHDDEYEYNIIFTHSLVAILSDFASKRSIDKHPPSAYIHSEKNCIYVTDTHS